jgi:hypothetical protein
MKHDSRPAAPMRTACEVQKLPITSFAMAAREGLATAPAVHAAVRSAPAGSGFAGWHSARVRAVAPQLQVQPAGQSQTHVARLAASALLQPQVGDLVLLAWPDGHCWVLSVLERHAGSPARLSVPGASSLALSSPKLQLQADHSLDIQTHRLELQAQHSQLRMGVVKLTARLVQVAAERLCTWAEVIQTRAQSLLVRAEQRVSQIDQVDLLHAGQVLTQADQLMQLKARHLQAKAEETVVVDGKQILLG